MRKLTYHEFLAFLLIYAAYADQEFVIEEKETILEKIKHDDFLKMKRYYQTLNDKEQLDVILENKSHYLPTKKQIEKSLNDVKEVFLADHKFLPIEQCYYIFLNKFLLN